MTADPKARSDRVQILHLENLVRKILEHTDDAERGSDADARDRLR